MNTTGVFSIIKKLPFDHFGSVMEETLECLLRGQSVATYGIPGYGMDFFAKQAQFLIELNHPEIKTLLLNMELEKNKKAILDKFMISLTKTKPLNENLLSQYLKENKLIIVLTKVFSPKQVKFLKYINSLRLLNKFNFNILTVGNYTILSDSSDYLKYASNLFDLTKRVSNFDLDGVKRIVKINNKEYGWEIPLELSKRILFWSGGNPALVKYICMAIYEEGEKIIDHPNKLVKLQPLNKRLKDIASLIPVLSVENQIKLGILNNNGTIFSELLSKYLKNEEMEGIEVLFPNLTDKDRKVLSIFIRNKRKIITKDQLSVVLEQNASNYNYSQWAIYKAVERVRNKIQDKYTIKTHKGRGWSLEVE